MFHEILKKIETKTARLGIVGIGYVGRSLGEVFAQTGYPVIGFDINSTRVEAMNALPNSPFLSTTDFNQLDECDIICITVPTPIDSKHRPDLTPLKRARETVAKHLKDGQLIILESTVAPGTTREFLLPALEKTGRVAEEDFFVGFSPHRIDFGNEQFTIKNTPKVIAGLGEKSKQLVTSLYSAVIDRIVVVSTLEIAEFCKILENTYRFVNINLINELAEYAAERNIDMWETIDAANTKPFGFCPFYPGAGISGHCIPVDPYYLLDDAKQPLEILQQAARFHEKRIQRIVDKLFTFGKHPKVLIVGVAIKPGSDDARESVGLKIKALAEKRGARICYHDPHTPEIAGTHSVPLSEEVLQEQDLILIITDHEDIDYNKLLASQKPIIDTKNVCKGNQVIRI